jgi:hypothetical protein
MTISMLAICGSAFAVDYEYTARTAAPVLVSGKVKVGSFYWACKSTVCTITGPWAEPDVSACRLLAQKVGKIVSYGRPGRQLGSKQIVQCNSATSSTMAVPPASAPVNEVLKNPDRNLPLPQVDGKNLIKGFGPQIQQFAATDGCRYPGRSDSLGFSYRVIVAPDGAAVAVVEILQVLANGNTRTVFVSPDDHRSVRSSAPKVVDTGAAADVVRYMLRATDVRRRQSTKLIPSPYWAGLTTLRIGSRFTVRQDSFEFVYMIPYTMENFAPASAPEGSITFRGEFSPIRADVVGDGALSIMHSDGFEGWLTSYGRNFYGEASGNISFRTRQAVWPDGRLELPGLPQSTVAAINNWNINIRIPRDAPAGCSGSLGSLSARLEGAVNRPPSPPAHSDGFTGYLWNIPCGCGEPYDDDITRTRAFTSVIQACMANARGSALMCGLSAPMLNPRNAAGRHCTSGGAATRVDSGPMSCYAVPGTIRILENNR